MKDIVIAIVGAIGGVLTTLLTLFRDEIRRWWIQRRTVEPDIPVVQSHSKYRRQSIADIVKDEASKNGIHIAQLRFGDEFTINDLEAYCSKTFYPAQPRDQIHHVLRQARAKAFSIKYAEPREDEKIRKVSDIKLPGLKHWEVYFQELLKTLRVEDLSGVDVLNVGIGNGHAAGEMFKSLSSFTAVDVSKEALEKAHEQYPHMNFYVNDAEDLSNISNSSIDLYVSFRAYQSTLFDRRAALHEAYRVLRSGGVMVVSVPNMYLTDDGKVLLGLIPPDSYEPDKEYAESMACRIENLMRVLNFKDVDIDIRSPFEIYVYGTR